MGTLIIDIETAGAKFEDLDETTQEVLRKRITKSPESKGYEEEFEQIKQELSFSPLTGEVITIGVLDAEKNQAVVYFQAPELNLTDFEEENVKYKVLDERAMLEKFWQGARNYNEFVTFNGKGFDIPYLIIRSAIHRVRATKHIMSNRYLGSQRFDARHVDLQDELSFYGAARRQSLHLFCRAFGIVSPKEEGIAGSDVPKFFAEKKYVDIARYNARDLFATKQLYDYWNDYIRPAPNH